ncbi:hypothetical protein SLEP1_g47748 [Rubroshorea leprosula]|uniref:Uncharacterized protein n=1 Tax=Rubroshorea leprosula TaxID=152421 RepID=A0AAV5LT98_9ROSI|nr:hypothetical protein SLEP1_g47748 [Rubroshorea leprosula]
MEKSERQNQTQFPGTNQKIQRPEQRKQHLLWDCGSTLYDSFELNSFQRQLDSAIHSRTMSMPHFSDARPPVPPSPPVSKKSSKISRSFQKLFKSMFKSKQNSGPLFRLRSNDDEYYVYDKSGALTTIPEVPEIDFSRPSPEINSLVSKTASERFTAQAAASIGISCA